MGNRKSGERLASEVVGVLPEVSFAAEAEGSDSEDLTEILEGIEQADRARETAAVRPRPQTTLLTPDFNKD